jgi:hypothetical protein
MTESQSTAEWAATLTQALTTTRAEPTAAPAARPYLQVFGPGTGPFEFQLPETGSITVGRSEHADVHLPHHAVSRIHATVAHRDGAYILEDANSNFGTLVNSKPIQAHALRHGDSVQIGLYVIEFRTPVGLPGAAAAANRARLLLRTEFCLLPSAMRLRYRPLRVAPREVFNTGDTLRVGNGGLLIAAPQPPAESTCLELRLFWPNDQNKRYLGEIVGAFCEEEVRWICVKLHSVPKNVHRLVVAAAQPGDWCEVAPT